jgi:hypothetical protein
MVACKGGTTKIKVGSVEGNGATFLLRCCCARILRLVLRLASLCQQQRKKIAKFEIAFLGGRATYVE